MDKSVFCDKDQKICNGAERYRSESRKYAVARQKKR